MAKVNVFKVTLDQPSPVEVEDVLEKIARARGSKARIRKILSAFARAQRASTASFFGLGLVDHALHIRRHYGSMPSERLYRNLGKAFIAYGEEVARETAR